jgi:peptidyl-prolyl cis-trans isomerase C
MRYLMKIHNALPLAALALLAACSKGGPTADTTKPADKPVATVNGTPISRAMFEYYAKNTAGKPAAELTPEQRAQLLDNLIRGEIIAEEALKEGLDKNTDTASLLTLSRLEILQQAGATHYLEDKKPTDAELKVEYDAQVAGMPKMQYHARHILVSSQDAAQKIIDQLKKGAKFEDLAKKDSIDSSKDQGGELGWFTPSNMVKPFADAVVSLNKGEITPAPVQPLDQVKDRVAQLVETKKFRAYQDELLKTAKVEKNLDSLGPTAGPVPGPMPGAVPAAPAPAPKPAP